MYAVKTPGGICLKMKFGKFEISVSMETRIDEDSKETGVEYHRNEIKVFSGESDVTEFIFHDKKQYQTEHMLQYAMMKCQQLSNG